MWAEHSVRTMIDFLETSTKCALITIERCQGTDGLPDLAHDIIRARGIYARICVNKSDADDPFLNSIDTYQQYDPYLSLT